MYDFKLSVRARFRAVGLLAIVSEL